MTRSRIARLVATLATTLVALAGLAVAAAPAQAAIEFETGAGAVRITALCQPGRLTFGTSIGVQSGYTQGQYMVYRYHLTSSYGHNLTSGWSGSKLMPYSALGPITGFNYTYVITQHSTVDLTAMRGALWAIKVQIGRWVPGYGWTYTGWMAPTNVTRITSAGTITAPWAACNT